MRRAADTSTGAARSTRWSLIHATERSVTTYRKSIRRIASRTARPTGPGTLLLLDEEQLAEVRSLLDAMRELTDRHRARVAASSEG